MTIPNHDPSCALVRSLPTPKEEPIKATEVLVLSLCGTSSTGDSLPQRERMPYVDTIWSSMNYKPELPASIDQDQGCDSCLQFVHSVKFERPSLGVQRMFSLFWKAIWPASMQSVGLGIQFISISNHRHFKCLRRGGC